MIYPIVIYGSQVLRNKSVEINADYPDFKKLIEDMWLTLGEASGVGLAAPQIGKNIRLFIVDCTPWAEEVPELENFRRVFVNPEIYERSSETGPKISSIKVITAEPIKALKISPVFRNFSPILPKRTKQSPPAEIMLGWVCPRHKISIIP